LTFNAKGEKKIGNQVRGTTIGIILRQEIVGVCRVQLRLRRRFGEGRVWSKKYDVNVTITLNRNHMPEKGKGKTWRKEACQGCDLEAGPSPKDGCRLYGSRGIEGTTAKKNAFG